MYAYGHIRIFTLTHKCKKRYLKKQHQYACLTKLNQTKPSQAKPRHLTQETPHDFWLGAAHDAWLVGSLCRPFSRSKSKELDSSRHVVCSMLCPVQLKSSYIKRFVTFTVWQANINRKPSPAKRTKLVICLTGLRTCILEFQKYLLYFNIYRNRKLYVTIRNFLSQRWWQTSLK